MSRGKNMDMDMDLDRKLRLKLLVFLLMFLMCVRKIGRKNSWVWLSSVGRVCVGNLYMERVEGVSLPCWTVLRLFPHEWSVGMWWFLRRYLCP
jgi:hypothetical protein